MRREGVEEAGKSGTWRGGRLRYHIVEGGRGWFCSYLEHTTLQGWQGVPGMARARDGCTGTWNRQHYRHAREVNKWQEVAGEDCAGNRKRQHYRDGREVQIWQDEVAGMVV